MQDNIRPPKGITDEEAADWYEAHPEYIDTLLDHAEAQGELKRKTRSPAERLAWAKARRASLQSVMDLEQPKGTVSVTLRLSQEDVGLAKLIAEYRGVRYQSYIKMLLHKVLNDEYADLRDMEKRRGFRAVQWHDPSINNSRFRVWHFFDVVSDGRTYDETYRCLSEMGIPHTTIIPTLVEANWINSAIG